MMFFVEKKNPPRYKRLLLIIFLDILVTERNDIYNVQSCNKVEALNYVLLLLDFITKQNQNVILCIHLHVSQMKKVMTVLQ